MDMIWYSLDTLKTDAGWKVALISEAPPAMTGASLYYHRRDLPQLEQTFRDFAAAMGSNDYQAAVRLLTGPVLGQDLSNTGPLFKDISQLDLQPLWEKGGIVAARIAFTAASGEQTLLVSFVQLSNGAWKIIAIS
jgi:hypothetical protein